MRIGRNTARIGASEIMLLLAATCFAHGEEPPTALDSSNEQPAQGHGSFSIGFQNTYIHGLRIDNDTVLNSGNGRNREVQLDLEYFVADRWSLRAGIPYVSNVFRGYPHCPTFEPPECRSIPHLNPQHPESRFQESGVYHGAWQDWDLGLAYHTSVGGDYLLTPSLTAYVPSHDYTFFSDAAPGQGFWRLEGALELAHWFQFSNWFYRARYAYVYTEEVFNTRLNHHRADLELGYFINEALSVRGFTTGKKGQGYTLQELAPLLANRTSEYWYRHDQIVVHDYADIGAGLDYRFAGQYTFSTAVHKLIWGLSVNNFKYSIEGRLTREF